VHILQDKKIVGLAVKSELLEVFKLHQPQHVLNARISCQPQSIVKLTATMQCTKYVPPDL